MGKVYLNQSYFRLKLDTKIDISEATSLKIKYISPTYQEGEWNADQFESSTFVYKNFTNNDGSSELNEVGLWIVWPFITASDGRTLDCEPARLYVYKPGN